VLHPALILTTALAASVSIQARVDGRAAPAGWVYARVGQKVVLQAVLTGAKAKDVRWFKLEPTTTSVDNTQPSFHFEPIAYREHELAACRGQLECPADALPLVLPTVTELNGAGTMAFQVRVTPERGPELKTPGLEAGRRGGLSRSVMRVACRNDDSYLGYLGEVVTTP
jgi:hypothetical protein